MCPVQIDNFSIPGPERRRVRRGTPEIGQGPRWLRIRARSMVAMSVGGWRTLGVGEQ